MTEFSPASAALGGALIGLSAVMLLWLNGRIAGISGILYGVFNRDAAERDWRLLFVVGLVLGGAFYQFLTGRPLASPIEYSPLWLIAAGLLVGFGTRLGNGCTSGHGVCGVSRLSKRSLLATLLFVAVGMATASIVYLLMGAGS